MSGISIALGAFYNKSARDISQQWHLTYNIRDIRTRQIPLTDSRHHDSFVYGAFDLQGSHVAKQAIFCAANTQYSCKSMINFTELNGKYDLEVYFPGVRFSRVRECIAKQCSVLRE